jgi:hypothetical protein
MAFGNLVDGIEAFWNAIVFVCIKIWSFKFHVPNTKVQDSKLVIPRPNYVFLIFSFNQFPTFTYGVHWNMLKLFKSQEGLVNPLGHLPVVRSCSRQIHLDSWLLNLDLLLTLILLTIHLLCIFYFLKAFDQFSSC